MPNFPQAFAATVARFPERPAISVRRDTGVERLTYKQLGARAAAISDYLADGGIGKGDRCAILAENSADWCAAYLGILGLSAVVVPFDTAYSTAQVAKLVADSGAKCLIASERFAATAASAVTADPDSPSPVHPGLTCELLALETLRTLPDAPKPGDGNPDAPKPGEGGPGGTGARDCAAAASDPAVILYTSGTTADPKGVILTHGNLLAEKVAALQVVHVNEQDAVLGVLPLFHSLAQMANLLLPFSLGAHVVFLETLNTRELLRALQEEQISVFCCVPQFFYLIHERVTGEVARSGLARRTLFRLLLRVNTLMRTGGINGGRLMFGRVHAALGEQMRLLITGGSRFDPAVGRDLHALGFTILQVYGLTETSGAATITRPGEPIETVGRPLPGVDIRIAPPAAEDIDGEILVRGPIVMAGYWGRADATNAVLRDGWFHTGDLGRLDALGRLTITGRSKEVIVLGNGKNIYPEEIEARYRQSPFIREICVMGVTDGSGHDSERLHAIVVPDDDVLREKRIVNVGELIRFEMEGLSVSLPPHKRVLGFDISMDPLVRTTTGKLKRHEIQKRYSTGQRVGRALPGASKPGEGGSGRVRPTDDERLPPHVADMVRAVREIANKPVDVGPESNFELDLGLDSLERVELLAALEQRLGVRLPAEQAQRAFTVRDLAEAFAKLSTRTSEPPPTPSERTSWTDLLSHSTLAPEQQAALRKPRRVTAILTFSLARMAAIMLFRSRVAGIEQLPKRGPYIISPNHQSYLDPFALVGVLPFGVFRQLFFVGAAEYFQSPIAAWLARSLNVIPVDPDANLLSAMQAGAFGLTAGKILVLFPEGERSIDGTVRKFKKGAGILAEQVGAPIVPVAIDGMFEIWPRNRPLDWKRLLPWSGHRVTIRFGRPLAPSVGQELRHAVEQLWLEGRT